MKELPKSRLATTDETGKRVYLYPAIVDGFFRQKKQIVHFILMAIFLILPWIHIHGQQVLLLDVSRREFFIFGLHLRAHDAPLLVFLLFSFAFLIGGITAIWGRLWCGWACPQTVYTEFVYRKIETWIEGNHRERRALDDGPWTAEKIRKKILKYSAFLIISLIIMHSFLAYFVGSKNLLLMVSSSPTENWASFLVILFTTAIILIDFGWFREQFCIIACPYGRFQSVLLGAKSLIVGYDTKRGEPRKGATQNANHGDCVNCFRCVQVCPTGIDIRRGLQMECITCTACIDACDEVMTKIKKPTGLIRYGTLESFEGNSQGKWNIRALIYGTLFLAAISGLTIALSQKDFLDVAVLRAKGAPYELVSNAQGEKIAINHFHAEISNQTNKDETVKFALENTTNTPLEFVMPMNPAVIKENAQMRLDFFIRFPANKLGKGQEKIYINMESSTGTQKIEIPLVGPDA